MHQLTYRLKSQYTYFVLKSQNRLLHKFCVPFGLFFFTLMMPDCKPQSVILYISGKTLVAGRPVHKHGTSFCKPKTISRLVLHMFIQMLLKTLFYHFFMACSCQRVARLLDFDFPSTSYQNSKIARDPT